MKRTMFIIIAMIVIICAACSPQAAETPTPTVDAESEATGVIILGDIDEDDPVSKVEQLQPLIDYVAANLSEFGIARGEVRVARDLDGMTEMMGSGEVNLYYDSLFPALVVSNATGARPLVRGWRGGEPVYHTVFFARADSGLTNIEDLTGRMVAFDDPSSTSGFMMPIAHLVTNGLNPIEQSSRDATVPEDEVGYIFSNDDDNTVEWVISGIVDVGAVDDLTFMDIPEETREQLVIIGETSEVPRRVVMVGADVSDELANAVREILIGMDETEDGQALLEIVRTTQFDEFSGGAEAAFEPILEMFEIFNSR